MNAAHEQHAAEAKAKQSAARARKPAEPLALTPGEAAKSVPAVELPPSPEAVALAEALAPAGAKVVSVKQTKATKPVAAKATSKPKATKAPVVKLEKVGGQVVRDFMVANNLSGKDLASIGGFSLSRVAELRNLEMPASWGGRDRHATTRQWGEIETKAKAFVAKRDAKAAKKG